MIYCSNNYAYTKIRNCSAFTENPILIGFTVLNKHKNHSYKLKSLLAKLLKAGKNSVFWRDFWFYNYCCVAFLP